MGLSYKPAYFRYCVVVDEGYQAGQVVRMTGHAGRPMVENITYTRTLALVVDACHHCCLAGLSLASQCARPLCSGA